MSEAVYRRAEGPYPLILRSLDALHLAGTEVWLSETEHANDPAALAVWTLDKRMNHCAAHYLKRESPQFDETAWAAVAWDMARDQELPVAADKKRRLMRVLQERRVPRADRTPAQIAAAVREEPPDG